MDFGKVAPELLDTIDWKLPPDPTVTGESLATGTGNTKFYVGAAKWGLKNCEGSLFPQITKAREMLGHYSRTFNACEFSGLFYGLQPAAAMQKWAAEVPEDFRFIPKLPQTITHYKKLVNAEQELVQALDCLAQLGNKCGPLLLLPNPQISSDQLQTVGDFLAIASPLKRLFLEMRHPSWFRNGYDERLGSILKSRNQGAIITDTAGRRDCVHMTLTKPECFVRFVGNGLHSSDYARIDAWVSRISSWKKQGLATCYFFVHQHFDPHAVELLQYLIDKLNDACDAQLKPVTNV